MKTAGFASSSIHQPLRLVAALVLGSLVIAADEQSGTNVPPSTLNTSRAVVATTSANYSFAISEVLKMQDAKVSPDIIRDFIQVSTSPFQATASDIIALKQRGVPEDFIQAMLRRDGQLQSNPPSAVAQQQQQQAIPQPTVQPPPVYGPPAPPSTIYYSQPVAEYPTYYYGSYPYYYSSYVYGGWGWPGYGFYWNGRGGGYRGSVHTIIGYRGGGWGGGHPVGGGGGGGRPVGAGGGGRPGGGHVGGSTGGHRGR